MLWISGFARDISQAVLNNHLTNTVMDERQCFHECQSSLHGVKDSDAMAICNKKLSGPTVCGLSFEIHNNMIINGK